MHKSLHETLQFDISFGEKEKNPEIHSDHMDPAGKFLSPSPKLTPELQDITIIFEVPLTSLEVSKNLIIGSEGKCTMSHHYILFSLTVVI